MFWGNLRYKLKAKTLAILMLGTAIAVTIIATTVNACFNPADTNAIEVLFNKYSVSYNLTALIAKFKPIVVEEGRIYVFKYVYRTLVDGDLQFGIIIYLERFCGNAPCVEGYNEDKPTKEVLALRLEPLDVCTSKYNTTTTDYLLPSIPTPYPVRDTYTTKSDTLRTYTVVEKKCPEKLVMNLVFIELLKKLLEEGVILGLDTEDIYAIMDAVTSNLIVAGWNNRLLYSEKLGKWAPYAELINIGIIKGVLVKGITCSFSLPQEVIDKVETLEPGLIIEEQVPTTSPPIATPTLTPLPQTIVTVTVKEREVVTLTTTIVSLYTATSTLSQPIPSTQQYSNGLLVGISLSIGIIASLAVHIIWRLKSKP